MADVRGGAEGLPAVRPLPGPSRPLRAGAAQAAGLKLPYYARPGGAAMAAAVMASGLSRLAKGLPVRLRLRKFLTYPPGGWLGPGRTSARGVCRTETGGTRFCLPASRRHPVNQVWVQHER